MVQILKGGYSLPFRTRPRLTRSPTVISCYVNPRRNSYLLEALHQLMDKNAIKWVQIQTSLGFFNRLFLVPKPKNKWRPILDLSKLNLYLKMETPETIRTSLLQGEWVTSIDFKDAYFHIPIQEQSRKYHRFHGQGQTYQFKALPFSLSTAPWEFTVVAKEVKLMAAHKGIRIHQYLDDWLVRAKYHRVCLQHTQDLVNICQELGWMVNLEKSELEPKQIFDFVGYQFDLKVGWVRPTLDRWQNLQEKLREILSLPTCPVRQFMSLIGLSTATEKQVHLGRLHMRPIQWHLKKQLESTRITRKSDPGSQVAAPTLTMVATGGQHSHRSAITPNKAFSASLYRRIKRRLWRSLKRTHGQRGLVTARKQAAYKLSGTKELSFSSSERVLRSLYQQDSTCSNRQHYSGVLHKQGGRHEVGPAVCPTMENLDLVYQTSRNSKSPTHPRPAECSSRQAIQTGPDHSNGVVPPTRRFPSDIQQVAPTSNRPICHEVQQQVTSVCVTDTGSPGHSSRCTQPAMGGSGRICLSTSSHFGQSGGKVTGLPMQENHCNCPGVAQHALVLGPGDMSSQIPLSLPNLPNLLTQPFNQSPHRNLTNLNLHAWLLEPQQSKSRASLKQWQQELRLLKGDQPDQSMRQSGPFLQNGASVIRWTSGHPP